MKKPHSKPEFAVIKLDQNNTKFFVASGGGPTPSNTGSNPPTAGGTLGSMTFSEEESWGDSDM